MDKTMNNTREQLMGKGGNESHLNDWVLTIYNDEDEIKHQEFFNQMEEHHASKGAEIFVDRYTDYDDGWDWTLMPKSFWDSKKK